MTKAAAPFLLALLFSGCVNPQKRFADLSEEFVYRTLAFSPVAATAAGLHQYEGRQLDEMLDDFSPGAIERQRQYYAAFRDRLRVEVKRDQLPPQDRADEEILQNQISLALLELTEIQSHQHNPTLYVETIGNALFNPYVLEYAPAGQRIRHVIARLRQIPLFIDSAKINLISAPAIWTRVAIEENTGNIELVDKTLRQWAEGTAAREYAAAAKPALEALRNFQEHLAGSLASRDQWDWRLRRERYDRKFRWALASGIEPEVVLATATAELEKVRAHMLDLSLAMAGGAARRPAAGDLGARNAIIAAALDRIAARHSTRDSYIPDARAGLEEARSFVREKNLLTLPGGGNLRVIETPEFLRGVYAVGGFNPAPALEPQLGAFYWITPIPSGWPAARAASKLREYNFHKLKLLTLHEAIPGHYVQAGYANALEPRTRRLVRSLFGNGPYIEGWAQYATEAVLDAGFPGGAEMRLTFAKERLRVVANAILDIRLHTLDMSDQEALDLMRNETFQEAEEAAAKLQRAKLSSCQLPTYFVGWQAWKRVRDQYRAAKGSAFRPAEFHDRALRQGAVPLPVLGRLLTGG